MERIMDGYEASMVIKKSLQEVCKLSTPTSTILSNVNDKIKYIYEGKKIGTELSRNYLVIYSEKRKNSSLNEIKNVIEDMVREECPVDLHMVFSFYENDNKIVISCKRNMEQ